MQTIDNMYASRERYDYLEPTIEAIKKLKRKPGKPYKLADLIRAYRTENDISKTIKSSTPLILPYSVIDTKRKLVADNIKSLEMLVLDIDSGCEIETFIEMNRGFDYYLYSTVTHRVTGVDKFRVIIPLSCPMPIDDAISRKQAIMERFSINGKTYLDQSFLDKSRGFVIPVELEFFREYESEVGSFFNLDALPKTDFIPVSKSKLAIEGFTAQDGIPEIAALADRYGQCPENGEIEINGTNYPRNEAFFWLHVEIAKYRPTEDYQKQLATRMNWDGQRNTTDNTVENARKHCSSVNLSALTAMSSQYWSEVKTTNINKYLEVTDIAVHSGKKHLLTATTGTGKTSLFLGDNFAHKVIFAVPINTIGQQAHSKYKYPFLRGTSATLPTENKVICSYNYLVELFRIGIPDDFVIVLDEFHRVLSDDFRTGKLSELVDLIAATENSVFCVSGTFDPSLFNVFKFDHHYSFKAIRNVRKVQVWETGGTLDSALIHFLKDLKQDTNNLVLFDDKNLLKSIQEVMPDVKIVTKDDKEFVELLVDPDCLNGKVTGTILTTQVLMEGINLFGLDNIVVVAKKHYGKEQIVQFFERDRDLNAKCHIIRKPVKAGEICIPDSDKEKEYQNQIFDEVINRIGLDGMKLIGVKDADRLLRSRRVEDEHKVYINCLYAPMKQKQAMDIANFKELNLSQYDYELLGATSLEGSPIQALKDIKRFKAEREKAEYATAIDLILAGGEAPDFPELSYLIARLQEQGIEQIKAICMNKDECQAYIERFSCVDSKLENAIYEKFKIGSSHTMTECREFLSSFVGQKSPARVNKNNYIKVFKRYFHLTQVRKTTKKEAGIVLDKVRGIGSFESISDLAA